ncbi:tetratricopeptide (TPR) repeat protein [Rhizobium sp. BK650]|uniref:tetratricopeptide repeat protein n=1 Tax=Rhizobium sp. BK650 TaxID=2586990 RepID=UPI00160F9DCD|nr:tetratricopeptide repeat protein [Rhizobium sp. BK650]MBB3655543.1 tetratricopeptide (TPR) repeat protein [Rhizobium sp. BK650]
MPSSAFSKLKTSDWSLRGGTDSSRDVSDRAAAPAGRRDNLPSIRAKLVQDAIKRGDFATATRISSDTLAASRAKIWTFYPFDDFIKTVSDLSDPSFERDLSAWVDHGPLDPLPRLVRAQYYYDLAWYKRGDRFSTQTDKQSQAAFASILKKGIADVSQVLKLDPTSAYGLYLQVNMLRGYGATSQLSDALDQAIAVYPSYLPLYKIVLSTLQPKWGGDINMMYEFVERHSANAPDGSPLKLLPLQLYQYLLETAGTTCYGQHGDAYASCFQDSMKQTLRPGLDAEVAKALRQFGQMNEYETNAAVSDILSAMIAQSGGESYSGRLLQIAADSYGADPRLVETDGGKHNFIIDKLVAGSWLNKRFYDNAITKYKEALSNMEAAPFPTPEQKDIAVADIHESLAWIYSRYERPTEMIASAKAALALDGKAANRIYLCFGNYQIKQYDAALEECSQITVDPQSAVEARYWRGLVYQAMKNDEKAIEDLTEVANSQDDRRAQAAIELSMIYFNRKDNKGALDVLNRYPYLYDTDVTAKDSVAVSYNNRCYAYMELGELQKALDDCNASLANGSIPDAFKKKEELVARLSR